MLVLKRIINLSFLVIIAAGSAFCHILPDSLKCQGKPIDPYCMIQITEGDSSRFKPISLKKCYKDVDKTVVHSKKTESEQNIFIKRNWTAGYSYTYRRAENQEYFDRFGSEECYAHWKYLGSANGCHIIFTNNGCYSATGRFSSIVLVKAGKNTIQNIGEIAGGDRANGGIESATYSSDKLSYTQWHTPYQLFNLWLNQKKLKVTELGFSKTQLKKIQRSVDKFTFLDDCAICGVATVNFVRSIKKIKAQIAGMNLILKKFTLKDLLKVRRKNLLIC